MALAVAVLGAADPTVLGVFILVLSPGIIATGLLVWKDRPGFYLLAGVANSLLALTAIPFGLLGALGNPLLGAVYIAVVLSVLSLLLALPAGVFGFLRGRSGIREKPLRQGIFTLQGLGAVALVSVSIGAIAAGYLAYQNFTAPPATPPTGYDFTRFTNVSMSASNSRFSPSAFNVTVFTLTRITVLNEDDTLHTFTYVNNGTSFSHDLTPGSATRFFVLFTGPGTVPFWSIPDQGSGMVGNITVNAR
jgi:plastocyanin